MRSVEVYLRNTNQEDVAAFLKQAFPLQEGPPWIHAINGDACLYIDFNPYSKNEHEADDWSELVHGLGCEPQVVVTANVSGRHPGDEQVRQFIKTMLTAFEGVAHDEYTAHCWSRDEVLSNHKIQGHHFFDYQGWFDEEKAQNH